MSATGAGDPVRRREAVLAELRDADVPLSITELAERLDVHPNTARFHLRALEHQGRVERAPSSVARPGRPPQRYRVRGGMDPAGPRNYRLLAQVLVDSLSEDRRGPARALAAGRSFGRRLVATAPGPRPRSRRATVRRLVALLEQVGFAPQERSGPGSVQIGLHHCPFLDLADDRRDVICPVHLGLMQGAVAELAGDGAAAVTVETLEPFVAPDLCLATLGTPAL